MTQPPPPPYSYGTPPAPGWGGQDGPPGRVRPTGTVLLLAIVTLGIYVYVYNYQVHYEMKRHSGRGLGGGIALLLTFLAGIAMPFLTPSEIGNLYTRKGQKAPVNGWTGLWFVAAAVIGYVVFFVTIFASIPTDTGYDEDPSGAGIAAAFLLLLASFLVGGIIWLVKTNGALNRYWQTLA